MTTCLCLATRNSSCRFEAVRLERHAPGPRDVVIDVKYCGVCHSDVHFAKNDFFMTPYPCVPGHEIAGVVAMVGSGVTKVKEGSHVGVGCYVDTCLDCACCRRGDDHFCLKGETMTYGSKPVHGRAGTDTHTKGGYSTRMVVDERFVVTVPKTLPLEKVGPLLCAGITTFSPLVRFGVGPGKRVGVNGLGGLGTMAVKQAKAMGASVTVISRSMRKASYAKSIGADAVVASSDVNALKAAARSLDLVIDTVAALHDIGITALSDGGAINISDPRTGTLIDLLDISGTWVFVGASFDVLNMQPAKLLMHQQQVTGSKIGSIAQQQACVDFCAKHDVLPETDVRAATPEALADIYTALDAGNDTGVRYVIDVGGSLNESLLGKGRGPAPKFKGGMVYTAFQIVFLLNRMVLAKVETAVMARTSLISACICAALVTSCGVAALR